MYRFIILCLLLLTCCQGYSQKSIKTYYLNPYVSLGGAKSQKIKKGELTSEVYNKKQQLESNTFYINGEIFDSVYFLYDSKGRVSFQQAFQKFYGGMKKTTSSKFNYNKFGKAVLIINYDDYRYHGFSGFEKYFYQDTNLVRKESYNKDSTLVETVLYKRSAHILLTIRKGQKGEIQQINRETFDSKGQSIKLELNFSPRDENDLSFTKTFSYSYYPDGLRKSEDTIRYEYVYDSKKRWIFKTIYAGNKVVSSVFRQIE